MLTTRNKKTSYTEELLQQGKDIIRENSFYYTLHVLLKYYFVKSQDFYLLNFIKDITNSEMEFKVFMIYIEFAIYNYNTHLKDVYTKDTLKNEDDIVFILIAYIKKLYDSDHSVLKPFINSVSENEDDVLEKFNIVKTTYNLKLEALEKFEKINNAIAYLEKAKEHENEAKIYSNMAMELLHDLRGQFKNTLYNDNQPKLILKSS